MCARPRANNKNLKKGLGSANNAPCATQLLMQQTNNKQCNQKNSQHPIFTVVNNQGGNVSTTGQTCCARCLGEVPRSPPTPALKLTRGSRINSWEQQVMGSWTAVHQNTKNRKGTTPNSKDGRDAGSWTPGRWTLDARSSDPEMNKDTLDNG